MRERVVLALGVVGFVISAVVVPFGSTATHGEAEWSEAESASIRPGARLETESSICTSNFVFTSGEDVFLGTAAHCFSVSGSTVTNGCVAGLRPLGEPVTIRGATRQGALVYSSWTSMQDEDIPSDTSMCRYNDFALVKIHPDDHVRVSPSVRHFGGPEGLTPQDELEVTAKVITYGDSPLRPGVGTNGVHTHAREGYVAAQAGEGWTMQVYTVTPGLPGDSGSGVMTGDAHAVGLLVTGQVFPLAGSNGVTNLARALDYAQAATGFTYSLETESTITTGMLPG